MKTIIACLLSLGAICFLSGCSMVELRKPASSNAGTASVQTSVGQPVYSPLHSEIMRPN